MASTVWFARGLPQAELLETTRRSAAVVVVLSPAYLASPWCDASGEPFWRWVASLDPSRVVVVGARRGAILSYVEQLTLAPAAVGVQDVEALRAQGLEDADVLAVCETASYYAFANRIADGLGVQLEAHMESDAD